MKRPLLLGCICLIAIIVVWSCCLDAPPFYSDIPIKGREQILVTGQLYQKEYRSYDGTEQIQLYLKSIQIMKSGTGQVLQINPKSKIICEIKKSGEEPKLGQYLQISGVWREYEHATNPGQFDAADYYACLNIAGQIKNSVMITVQGSEWPIRESLFLLRNILQKRLYQVLPEKDASILAKMLLGISSGLDEEVKELYQRNGIIHILSISGLHITMIGMGVYHLLRRCSCSILPAAVIGVVFLLLYGCMTGFAISAVRAIGMYLIHMLAEVTGRSYDLLTAIGVVMLIMILFNHRMIFHCGFLLSFASVAAMGGLYPIFALTEVLDKKGRRSHSRVVCFFYKRLTGMLQGLWASTAVSIVTMPIMLYFFYEIPVYAPIINLLVLPFMGIVMTIAILIMVLAKGEFLAGAEHMILNGYEKVCLFFEKLPGHTWIVGRPQIWQIALYYAGLLLIIFLCHRKSRWWSLGMIVLVLILGSDFERETKVVFLDVGQGDCILVMTEAKKTYLFDGGSSTEQNMGEDIILSCMKYYGRSKLDGVFISHPDEDHISGIIELLEGNMTEVSIVYLPNVSTECRKDFEKILEYAEAKEVVYYSEGDYIKTEELEIICLHPTAGFGGDTNVYSGCFLLEKDGMRVLLTGDIEAQGEIMLTEKLKTMEIDRIQVLKVAHHGSKYSTLKSFLEQAIPHIAVISCGAGNGYGHPHKELLDRLSEYTDYVYTTMDSGAIIMTLEKERIKVGREKK